MRILKKMLIINYKPVAFMQNTKVFGLLVSVTMGLLTKKQVHDQN